MSRYLRLGLGVLLLAVSAIIVVFPSRSGLAQKNIQTPASRDAGPPNYDAFGASSAPSSAANAQASDSAQWENGHTVKTESRRGVPSFLWVSDVGKGQAQRVSSLKAQATLEIESAARNHLGEYGSRYRLSASDVAEAKLVATHNTGKGAIIAKFKQELGGIEVFHDEINIIMNQNLQLMAISGYLTGDQAVDNYSADYQLQPKDAVAKAIADLTGVPLDASILRSFKSDADEANAASGAEINPYLKFTGSVNAAQGFALGDEPARVKKVVYHLVDSYVPAYYVEASVMVPSTDPMNISSQAFTKELAYAFVISAVDGQILFRSNLTRDATYRVWADPVTKIPYDTPAGNDVHPKVVAVPDGAQSPFVGTNDITLLNYPFSQNDPWLAPGSTETNGNNVDAFLNLLTPDGFGNPTTTTPTDPTAADFRAQITGTDAFLHTQLGGGTAHTVEARQGSIQQLFYNLNFLHDWYYDAGFDEASGNAQTNNFGRGGLGADSIKGQIQDFQSFSNANMLTPADGGRPRMRMYVFPSVASNLDIQAPASIAAKRQIGISMSGPGSFDITAGIVLATFSNSPSACTVTNAAALAGKLALFNFDNTDGTGCSFSTRIARLTTTTSAVAIVMAYTSANPTVVANITGYVVANTKPVVTISWNSSLPIKTELAVPNVVTARLNRVPDRDGSIDNQIMFHEWGHYISNRLIGNGTGINTNYSGGLGEGWGDFTAMMLTVRSDDTGTPSNATWNGAYALATYATSGVPFNGSSNQGYYFGIRRYPYSTDLNINPLTFKHIQEGTPLPVGPPVAFGANGVGNSEVHSTGEVWTAMLWESYAALLRDTQGGSPRLNFAEAQDRMKNYLVAGYKMTPVNPTLLEARDAVLAAAYAYDYNDGRLIAQAFAKRGAGAGAVSPDRFSPNNTPVTESFTSDGALIFVGGLVDDSVQACDADGYLDNNEKGKLTVTIRNTGQVNLFNSTATVSSSNPAVTFPDGNTITFPPSQPNQNVSASVTVQASGLSGQQSTDFTVTIQDSGSPPVGPVVGTYSDYLNVDEIPDSTATDNVESRQNPWTTGSNPVFGVKAPWSRFTSAATAHDRFGPDFEGGADEYLTSPVFTVDGSGSFNLQFDHSFGFEFDGGGNYDGGVVEARVNGGAYTDISTAAYTGTLLVYSGNVNPLQGRMAFVQNSGGIIHTSLTRAIAPGSTVQVRYRIGSDAGIGAAGWHVDNIAFTGVVETPFATLVAESGVCNAPAPTIVLTPGTLPSGSVGTPYSGTLTASGGTAPYTYSVTPVILPPGLVASGASGSLVFSGTPTQAGTYLINVRATDSLSNQGNANYTINIGKDTPTITWSNPADITQGTPLSATQLNATASVPGAFTYAPPAGTVLNAGNGQALTVNFVPTDTARYNNASANVTINVLKATPTITWSNPADITYGTALSGTQLNATASVPGVLTYAPPSGTVLNAGNAQALSVNFVPTDTTNYNNTSKTVAINVLKATPVITWSNPADVVYGTALSTTQLNATASVPGTFTYTPPATTVLNSGNAQTLAVSFVPTDTANYSNDSKSVQINVTKADQTITFGVLSTKTFGGADFNVSATASSNLTVAFAATGSCTVSGSTVHLTGAGSCTITASQAGDSNFNAAANVPQTFAVDKASQTITFGVLSTKTFGGADFNVSATASSNLTVAFAATGSCTVSGSTVHLTGAGSCTITASQAGDSNFNPAANVPQTFAVDKASQTITFGVLSTKTFGDADFNISASASSTLTVAFAATGNCTVSGSTVHLTGAGSCTITASQGGDSNYNPAANVPRTFAVNKANQVITFGVLSTRTFGDADFNISASASSTLTVAFAATGNCTVSGSTVHLTGAGSCTITASQSGDSNYNAAANVPQPFAIGKTNQAISFGVLQAKTYGDADFNLGATASSNLTVAFAAVGNCTVTGSTVHLTAVGSCTITASQAGDSNYNPASNVPRSFSIQKAMTATGVTSSANPADVGHTVTFSTTVNAIAGTPTGTVQFKDNGTSIGGPQTLSSGQATFATAALTVGTHSITAEYSGDTNFNPSTGTLNPQVVTSQPSLSISDLSLVEGDTGTRTADFVVTLSTSSSLTVTVDYATAAGTATTPTDYLSASGTLTFAPGETTRTISVTVSGDQSFEPDETFFVNLSAPSNAGISDGQGLANIMDDDSRGGIFSFDAANYTVAENGRLLTVTVARTGDTSADATINYATPDDSNVAPMVPCATTNGVASSRCDFTIAAGTLEFAAGDTTKTFNIPISQDSYVEGPETFDITLSNPTGGASLGLPAITHVIITDDATEPSTNPIDDPDNFVRQHYHDFLNREGDPGGQAFWTSRITDCGSDALCIQRARVAVSAAFFIEQEFQETGFYVYRAYKGALGRPTSYLEFATDRSQLQASPILDAEKVTYTMEFVQRNEFTGKYSLATTAEAFVDALIQNVQTNSGVDLTSGRNELLAAYNGGVNQTDSRARTLRTLIDHADFQAAEYNRGFVLAQYFSYLQREPDPGGYDFWLNQLNSNPNTFSAMVCSFITSAEYQDRFGLVHSHSNADCGN